VQKIARGMSDIFDHRASDLIFQVFMYFKIVVILESVLGKIKLTRERWRGGYFDATRIHFSAVGIFL